MNRELGEAPTDSTLSLGDIAAAVALDYLAFRLPELAWQETYRSLASWQQDVITRSSFQAINAFISKFIQSEYV
ncbi:glutathione S-transferase C-terminal domain-containing protein [Vreelandella nanhaiensis]|uniref:glutathione S-transferase C-terminal domain-containing protein n=1 Tax=Vreelandella nanhaiensis TaxID=1258546 RepID=UPI0030EB4570